MTGTFIVLSSPAFVLAYDQNIVPSSESTDKFPDNCL